MAETKSAERKQAKAKRRRDKEVRPQEIVAAAFEEFADEGLCRDQGSRTSPPAPG